MPPPAQLALERPPRRARYLVPLGLPRRGEVLAALGIATVVASALFVPLALGLAVVFHAVSRVSRWRPAWLAVPASGGAVWLLAAGAPAAVAAFAAAVSSVAVLLSRLATGPAVLDGLPAAEMHGLARQLPVALVLAAAAAAIAWWLRWLHTDEWDLPSLRPGLASFCHGQFTAASVRNGGVVTRAGACLGADRVTGRPAALSWRDAGAGVLVTGAAGSAVLTPGLQLAHAAIRRRKPVVVVDLAGSRELPGVLAAVCAAAAAPLHVFGEDGAARYEPGQPPAGEDLAALRASPLGRWLGPGPAEGARISLPEVVRRRAVVLFRLDRRGYGRAAEVVANLVADDIDAVYSALGRKGVPAEGLAWFTECDGLDGEALARLAAPGSQPELVPVLSTTAPRTAARLAGRVGAAVVHRLADRELAGQLAALTGTRLVRVSHALAQPVPDEAGVAPRVAAGHAVPLGTMPFPVVPASALCELGDDEFVLVTGLMGGPEVTVLARCRSVAGRIPAAVPARRNRPSAAPRPRRPA
jgi:hypothetical protein